MEMFDFFIGFFVGVIALAVLEINTDFTYRHGQIDCMNGIIKLELVKQPDGETMWEWIRDEEKE